MKTLAVAAIAVALSAASASAQTTMTFGSTPPSVFGADPIIRVTSTFRTPLLETDAKAQETARRALYGMAESECAALSEIFRAECRLGSVSILIPIVPASAAPPNTMNATAVYELRPGRVASGR
jgi:hypothetical protein